MGKLNINRTITIKLDRNKEKETPEIIQPNENQLPKIIDNRSLLEKAKEIRIECKNDQVSNKPQEKPKFDDKETEQMLKDLHSCLPKKKNFKMSSLKVPRRQTSPQENVAENISRSIKRVKTVRQRSKSEDSEYKHKGERLKEKKRSRRNDQDVELGNDNINNEVVSPRNDGSLARKLYDRIERGSDNKAEGS